MSGKIHIKPILFLITLVIFNLSVFADGFIVIPRPPHPRPPRPFSPFPLEVVYHHVKVDINDQIATTFIDQEFYNPTRYRLEGYYLFPIPKNAVIKKFSMFVNGKEMEAELLDAKKARKIYEDIVRRQMDPALLEYSDTGVFKVRIFPIEPRSKKRVKISYHEFLSRDNNTIEYLYPLNTEKFSAKPLRNVSVKVEINSKGELKNIYCPTHKAEIIRKSKKRAIIGYEEKNVRPDIDFKLYYSVDDRKVGFSLLSYRKRGEDGYFFLSLSPSLKFRQDDIVQKDIVFVLDTSGSMAGEKLSQAKKALLFCVENLNKGDRFEIIRFSTEAETLFGNLNRFTTNSRNKAREFIKELRAIGGTNIDEALSLALNRQGKKERPYLVIFLTDGKPTIGETNENALLKKIKQYNIDKTRIFTFGIGNEINTHLLDKITEMTRAYRTYISPEEDIEVKVSNFYTKVQSPVFTDLKLEFSRNIRVSKIYPLELPDLFKGSSISIFGRYRGSGKARIGLRGMMRNRVERFDFDSPDGFKSISSPDSEKNDFIPPLWAARRIGYLLDQIRLHGKSQELIDEITELARTHGIITPYTSYLIVEDEKTRVRRREIRVADQTLAPAARSDGDFEKRNREEFSSMHKKSGSKSVQVSKEFQELNQASNYAQMRPGQSRLGYVDKEGKSQNIAQQVRNIQGRAVYNNGNFWVDSRIQAQKREKTVRIQFASSRYFDLLKNKPESGQFLALGKNVRFALNGTVYEIFE
jgi:Ca-activated chloride channel family protein